MVSIIIGSILGIIGILANWWFSLKVQERNEKITYVQKKFMFIKTWIVSNSFLNRFLNRQKIFDKLDLPSKRFIINCKYQHDINTNQLNFPLIELDRKTKKRSNKLLSNLMKRKCIEIRKIGHKDIVIPSRKLKI